MSLLPSLELDLWVLGSGAFPSFWVDGTLVGREEQNGQVAWKIGIALDTLRVYAGGWG